MNNRFFATLAFVFATVSAAPTRAQSPLDSLKVNGLYKVLEFKEVTPIAFVIDGKTEFPKSDEISYVLLKNEPIKAEFLPNGTIKITRGTTPAEEKINPSQMIIHEDQLSSADLEPINDPFGRDLTTLYVTFISEKSQTAARGRRGNHFYGGTCSINNWGTGQCVAFIKHTEGIREPLGSGGEVAYKLATKFKHLGYRSVKCSLNPTPGTIASWPGHVAKWDGSCWQTWPARACSCNNGDPGRGFPRHCVIKSGW